MTRTFSAPTIFIVVSMVLLLEASNVVHCQGSYQEGDEIMTLGAENKQPAIQNSINTCYKTDDFCDHGSRSCCIGSVCRCNLLGYNCRCLFDDDLSVSMATDQTFSRNPSEKLYGLDKRSCIRRGGACDHRPNECCFSSSCRCNLWGSNCRCQRAGLFQKWG